MSANFSAQSWSSLPMNRKLAIFDEQLQTGSTDLCESTVVAPASTAAVPQAAAPVSMTSVVMSVCAVASCGLASNYAYSSYKKWKRKQPKETNQETENEKETVSSPVTDLLSSLRSVYSSFTQTTTNKHTLQQTDTHECAESHREIIEKHQHLLNSLRTNLKKAGLNTNTDDTQLLNQTIDQLKEKFLVSVVGEFNSGKSAFINALLGGRFVYEGILPTTDYITKILYDEHESFTRNSAQNVMEVKLPVPWLKEVTIVDTPGTNALFELGHQAITEKFLPHSDLVLFVTSAERPLTESERQIIKQIRDWDRKIVVVVNKCDLRTEEEREEVIEYIRSKLEEIIPGHDIPIFAISARLALMAKVQSCYQEDMERASWQELWMASNLGTVERYMFESLDYQQKMCVKLQGPLSVANRFLMQYDARLQECAGRLEKEQALLGSVHTLVDSDFKKLCNDFKTNHLEQVEQCFARLTERMHDFVDHHISFRSFINFLLHPKTVQNTFREEVCQDFQGQIEDMSVKLTDWLTEARSRIVDDVMRELNTVSDRSTTVQQVWKNLRVGPVVLGQDHQLELRQFRESVRGIIEKFTSDERHSRALIDSVQTTLTQIVVLEAAAALTGLLWYSSFSTWLQSRNGATPAAKLYTMLAGAETSVAKELAKPLPMLLLLAGSSLLAVSGLNILQYRREAVKRRLGREANMCHERLVNKLDSVVQEKARKTVADTMLWLQPFVQAVKAEHDRIEEMKSQVGKWHEEVGEIQTMIGTETEKAETKANTEEESPYPVSKPLAYPQAVPLGPMPRQLSVGRKSVSAPPSYSLESPRYSPSAPLYPTLERRSSFTVPVKPQALSPQPLSLSRQSTPISLSPPVSFPVSSPSAAPALSASSSPLSATPATLSRQSTPMSLSPPVALPASAGLSPVPAVKTASAPVLAPAANPEPKVVKKKPVLIA